MYLCSGLEEYTLRIFCVENVTAVLSVVCWDVSVRKVKGYPDPSTSMKRLLSICENR
jgi:hypothetical protein